MIFQVPKMKRYSGNHTPLKSIKPDIQRLDKTHPFYPERLKERLAHDAPETLWALGSLDILTLAKTAFFCSRKCPGDAILKAMDQALAFRESGRCVIGGFHTSIEKECLDILMKGSQSIIVCPARSIEGMRIPKEYQKSINNGRLLLLSLFGPNHHRITVTLSEKRNLMVAALADEFYFAHAAPQSKTKKLEDMVKSGWAAHPIPDE